LYAFVELNENECVEDFILKTWIIWTPWEVFWSKKYGKYIRFSFWYES
jgi:hypothetical protein